MTKALDALFFICYNVALAVLPYLTLTQFLPPRRQLWRKGVLLLGAWITAAMIIFVGDAFNILATLPVFLLSVLLGAEGSRADRLSLTLIFFIIMTSISALADNLLPRDSFPDAEQLLRMVAWALLWLLFRRLLHGRRPQLSARLWLLLDGLALTPFVAMVAGVTLTAENVPPSLTPAYVILPFALVSGVSLLLAVVVLDRHQTLEREQQLAQARRSYYDQLEQQQQQVRRLRHDLANHLQTLAALPPTEQQDYLRQLLDDPALHSGRKYCDNAVVNAVLSAKAQRAEQLDVQTDFAAPLPAALPLEDIDLCALLGNSLDNAIEACAALPAQQRQVRLRARADKGVLALRVTNPCADAPQWEHGRLLSRKGDAAEHGWGTVSISSVAQKYGGTVSFSQQDGQFELMLYLPLAQREQS